ncbi:MAG TPA: ATP-binding protein, partial [Stellaceae bacterium]|nr:ATP-binding protein [Stellaceae bacterium]
MSSPPNGYAEKADLQFLVEKNADGIIVVDRDGAVLFANPAAEQLFGRPASTLIGTRVGIPMVAGETADILVLRQGGEKLDVEVRVVETIWNGRQALLASLRDISTRRIVEERLRHAAKMEAVGRLTAGVAHDFNNLLTVIIGNLECIRYEAAGHVSLLRAAENAMGGAVRAAKLTQRLLAFSRQQPSDARRIDVNQLVSGMSDLLHRTLGEAITIEVALDAEIGSIHAAPVDLESAILNLAVNSRDAMPAGGKLTIETRNVEFDDDYAATHASVTPGRYVLIAVTDTGTGMSKEVIDRAFEPFFTTKGIGQGTGLGLCQVYNFVRQGGGHVNIYSEPGLGTRMKMYFPRAAAAEPDTPMAPIAQTIPRGTPFEAILVVEDHPDVRAYSTATLRNLGYRVLEAPDGASALDIIEREPGLSLLFSDIGLTGGMDGRVLAKYAQ